MEGTFLISNKWNGKERLKMVSILTTFLKMIVMLIAKISNFKCKEMEQTT